MGLLVAGVARGQGAYLLGDRSSGDRLVRGAWAKPPSANTGRYCRARAKLPVAVVQRLVYAVGDQLEGRVPTDWLWHGRHVKLGDGTTVTAPDTPENQAAWPQSRSQKPGFGYPLLRLVVLFSLATAAVLGWRRDPSGANTPANRPSCGPSSIASSPATSSWATAVSVPTLCWRSCWRGDSRWWSVNTSAEKPICAWAGDW